MSLQIMALSSFQPPSDRQREGPFSASAPFVWHVELLDIIKQRWLVLIVVPLLLGALAVSLGFALNRDFVSASYLGPLDERSGRIASSLIYSPKVQDKVFEQFPDYPPLDADLSERRRRLNGKIRFTIARGSDPRQPGLYVLEVQDRLPERAQGIGKVIVDNWLASLIPPEEEMARLRRTLDATELLAMQLTGLTAELLRRPNEFMNESRSGTSALNYADLFRLRSDSLGKIEDLKARIAGGSRDLIFTAPMPGVPVYWSKVSLFAAVATLTFTALLAGLYWYRREMLRLRGLSD